MASLSLSGSDIIPHLNLIKMQTEITHACHPGSRAR